MKYLVQLLFSVSLLIITSCDSSSSPAAVGGGQTQIANLCKMSFDGDADTFDEDSFTSDLATAVGCDASQIDIVSSPSRGTLEVSFVFVALDEGGVSVEDLLGNVQTVTTVGSYAVTLVIENLSDAGLCTSSFDCENVCGGSATLDVCGVCDDDLTNDNSTCLDECGIPNGDNSTCTDPCGVVNGDSSTCGSCDDLIDVWELNSKAYDIQSGGCGDFETQISNYNWEFKWHYPEGGTPYVYIVETSNPGSDTQSTKVSNYTCDGLSINYCGTDGDSGYLPCVDGGYTIFDETLTIILSNVDYEDSNDCVANITYVFTNADDSAAPECLSDCVLPDEDDLDDCAWAATFDSLCLEDCSMNIQNDMNNQFLACDNTSTTDQCGVVNGDDSTCTDACGVVNGDDSTCTDACGVVNGDGSSCAGTDQCNDLIGTWMGDTVNIQLGDCGSGTEAFPEGDYWSFDGTNYVQHDTAEGDETGTYSCSGTTLSWNDGNETTSATYSIAECVLSVNLTIDADGCTGSIALTFNKQGCSDSDGEDDDGDDDSGGDDSGGDDSGDDDSDDGPPECLSSCVGYSDVPEPDENADGFCTWYTSNVEGNTCAGNCETQTLEFLAVIYNVCETCLEDSNYSCEDAYNNCTSGEYDQCGYCVGAGHTCEPSGDGDDDEEEDSILACNNLHGTWEVSSSTYVPTSGPCTEGPDLTGATYIFDGSQVTDIDDEGNQDTESYTCDGEQYTSCDSENDCDVYSFNVDNGNLTIVHQVNDEDDGEDGAGCVGTFTINLTCTSGPCSSN